jgi:nucleoside-diphosphate-sugar epimerase
VTAALRIAVTGGSGRIGVHVVRALKQRGHRVVNVDRRQAARPEAQLVPVDLRRPEWAARVLAEVDAVVHLAEIPDLSGRAPPDEVEAHNTLVTRVVLDSAAAVGVRRMVYASSCQVYGLWGAQHGARPKQLPFDESHPVAPGHAYARGKLANEAYARRVAAEHDLSVAVFRLPEVMVSWPTPTELRAGHHALRRFSSPLDGFGTYVRVDDVGQAFIAALERPRAGCDIYHLTAREVASAGPLREILAREYPDWPELPASWPCYASPVSCAKAREALDWQPRGNLLDVFREAFGHEPRSMLAASQC